MVDAAFFSGLKAPVTFTIIRHGQSEANARRVIQGLQDFHLDATGRTQAAELGAWLKGREVDAILSSPLSRAAETASILAASLGLGAPLLCPALRELDTGSFSGMSLEDAKDRFPEVYAQFAHRSWSAVPDAEGAEVLYERSMRAWEVLRAEAFSGKRHVACVSHGGFIQWLVRVSFGTRTWMPILPTGNCGIFELLAEPAGEGVFLRWERLNFQVPGAAKPIGPVF